LQLQAQASVGYFNMIINESVIVLIMGSGWTVEQHP